MTNRDQKCALIRIIAQMELYLSKYLYAAVNIIGLGCFGCMRKVSIDHDVL